MCGVKRANGQWQIKRSADGRLIESRWRQSSDLPVADYDGDGKADLVVFRRGDGHWRLQRSSDGEKLDAQWGPPNDPLCRWIRRQTPPTSRFSQNNSFTECELVARIPVFICAPGRAH